MKTVKKIGALIFIFILMLSAAQAETWKAAEANQPRFLELIDLLEASVTDGAGLDEAAEDAVLEAIRQDSADDYDIARAIADHWPRRYNAMGIIMIKRTELNSLILVCFTDSSSVSQK